MSDFGITTTVVEANVDTRWRALRHGQFAAQSGMLDLSKFKAGTHYNFGKRKDNVIPSGVAVQLDDQTGMYGPWDPAGDKPIAGYVNDNQGVSVVRADGTRPTKAAFARLLHGFIEAKYLPIAEQVKTAPTAAHTGQISYV